MKSIKRRLDALEKNQPEKLSPDATTPLFKYGENGKLIIEDILVTDAYKRFNVTHGYYTPKLIPLLYQSAQKQCDIWNSPPAPGYDLEDLLQEEVN